MMSPRTGIAAAPTGLPGFLIAWLSWRSFSGSPHDDRAPLLDHADDTRPSALHSWITGQVRQHGSFDISRLHCTDRRRRFWMIARHTYGSFLVGRYPQSSSQLPKAQPSAECLMNAILTALHNRFGIER